MDRPFDAQSNAAAAPTDFELDALAARTLEEDGFRIDVTTLATVPLDTVADARLVVKEDGIVAGLRLVERVFHTADPALSVTWTCADGEWLFSGTVIGHVVGSAHAILGAERTALNFLQRMSGIATATRRMVRAAGDCGTHILDTRKTAPGLRITDKWAVRLGGGRNHRFGLHTMILIKDNHIAVAGGVGAAIRAALVYRDREGLAVSIEVETRTMDEVNEALAAGGFDCILLDNMVNVGTDGEVDTSMLREALSLIDGQYPAEVSGNVTLKTIGAIAATGVDYVSCGALTHSVRALDISMDVVLTEKPQSRGLS